MPDKIKLGGPTPLKYEGIVSLIIDQFKEMKADNDKAFEKIHNYNAKQNGNIASALNKAIQNELEIVRLRSELQISDTNHTLNCPQSEKIRALEDNVLTHKSVKSWVVRSVSITGGLMAILWIVFQVTEHFINK